MARARNIKPGFFKNEVLAELPAEVRLLFIGLWTLADREGRLEDRPMRIKGELFPYESIEVGPMLTRLQAEGFLIRYEAGGCKYMQIVNFVKHQDPHYKEKASEIPAPNGHDDLIKAVGVTRSTRARILERDGYKCQQCGAEDHLCVDHILPVSRGGDSSDENLQVLCHACNTRKGNRIDGESKGFRKSVHQSAALLSRPDVNPTLNQRNGASPSDSLIPDSLIPDPLIPDCGIPVQAPAAVAAKRSKRVPADFIATDDLKAWAAEKVPGVDIETQTEAMRDHEYRDAHSDWPAAWRKWMRTAFKSLPKQRSGAPPNRQTAIEERNRAAGEEWLRQEGFVQ